MNTIKFTYNVLMHHSWGHITAACVFVYARHPWHQWAVGLNIDKQLCINFTKSLLAYVLMSAQYNEYESERVTGIPAAVLVVWSFVGPVLEVVVWPFLCVQSKLSSELWCQPHMDWSNVHARESKSIKEYSFAKDLSNYTQKLLKF